MTTKHVPWTLNNFTEDELEALKNEDSLKENKVRYMLFVEQKAPKTGTIHLQGYTQFTESVRPSKMKKFSKRIHFEKNTRGSAEHNISYILDDKKKTNQGEPWSWGTPCLGQGQRTDISDIAEAIMSDKKTEKEIATSFPDGYLKYHNGIRKLCDIAFTPKPYERSKALEVNVIIGPSGVGKSWVAEQKIIDAQQSAGTINQMELAKGWFTGYNKEHVLFLDEFRPSSLRPCTFLQLCDGKMKELAVKGGYRDNEAKVIWITTPEHPIHWWPDWMAKTDNNFKQIARRITNLWYMPKRDFIIQIDPFDHDFQNKR